LASTEAAMRGDEIISIVFGRVRLADYVRFQERHTRHHLGQMTWS
jgi:hypothetical protein